jgi:hypothetical protein
LAPPCVPVAAQAVPPLAPADALGVLLHAPNASEAIASRDSNLSRLDAMVPPPHDHRARTGRAVSDEA